MLTEVPNARQHKNEPFRRCFNGNALSLYVWFSNEMDIVGFQLCYKSLSQEKALTWHQGMGYSHENVDNGEVVGKYKMSPILFADGILNKKSIAEAFKEESINLEKDIKEFILKKIRTYQAGKKGAKKRSKRK